MNVTSKLGGPGIGHRIAERFDFLEHPSINSINMQVRTGVSVPFAPYMLTGEAPSVDGINMQVRTGVSVPFAPYMVTGDAPSVDGINMQVRTGVSVPFAPYMATGEAPSVDGINMQVRTGVSVPFASYMVSGDAPSVDGINMQVRTGVSVPYADYMKGRKELADGASAKPIDMQVRTGVSVPFNPYMLGAHAEELLKRRVMMAPVLVEWRYRIVNEEGFRGWLKTKEILLSEQRMGMDAEIKGVRYGGTYRVSGDQGGATFKTVWGYTNEVAMATMHRLCSDSSVSATLVQLELVDFVKGMKTFISAAGDQHFTQDVLVSAAAG
jgi:hypothetical protein